MIVMADGQRVSRSTLRHATRSVNSLPSLLSSRLKTLLPSSSSSSIASSSSSSSSATTSSGSSSQYPPPASMMSSPALLASNSMASNPGVWWWPKVKRMCIIVVVMMLVISIIISNLIALKRLHHDGAVAMGNFMIVNSKHNAARNVMHTLKPLDHRSVGHDATFSEDLKEATAMIQQCKNELHSESLDKRSPLKQPSSAMSRLKDPNSLKFFVHLWKTGGSTVEFLLDKLANSTSGSESTRKRNALNMRLKDPVLAQYDWLEPEAWKNFMNRYWWKFRTGAEDGLSEEYTQQIRRLWSSYEFVYGHFISGVHEVLDDSKPFSYFTILRDPIDRIASLYEFWKQIGHGEKDLNEKSLKDFVEFLPEKVNGYLKDNHLVRVLCPEASTRYVPIGHITHRHLLCAMQSLKNEFGLVMILEKFEESVEALKWLIGDDSIDDEYPIINASGMHTKIIEKEDDETIAALQSITYFDRLLYTYGLCLFEKQRKFISAERRRTKDT